jgi:hypothetical protein
LRQHSTECFTQGDILGFKPSHVCIDPRCSELDRDTSGITTGSAQRISPSEGPFHIAVKKISLGHGAYRAAIDRLGALAYRLTMPELGTGGCERGAGAGFFTGSA